jgi:hypothetical protein
MTGRSRRMRHRTLPAGAFPPPATLIVNKVQRHGSEQGHTSLAPR